MNTKNKLGFDGQWVDGTPVGKHVDSDGDEVNINEEFLRKVVANFEQTKAVHSVPVVPIVVDHPESNGPAYGWVEELRVNNGRLERRFADVNTQFEDAVKAKAFRKRSDAFYLNPKDAPLGLVPALRHVGFLGAKIPAIKGVADIQFSADEGKTVDVEVDTAINFSEGDTETMKDEEVKKTIRESIAEFFEPLTKMLKGDERPAAAMFSEVDRQKLIDDATAAATAKFSEELKKRDGEIETLKTQVDTQGNGSRRAEVVAFFEQMQAKGILPPALKTRVVNLMDALAGLPDKKVTVITFEEEGGKQVERKEDRTLLREFQEFVQALPPYIRFGESFGNMKANGSGQDVLDPQYVEDRKVLRVAMNVKDPETAAK